jgi:hypothetical protein
MQRLDAEEVALGEHVRFMRGRRGRFKGQVGKEALLVEMFHVGPLRRSQAIPDAR